MSHFTTMIITKKKPTNRDIETILEPYSENIEVAPYVWKTKAQLIEDKKSDIEEVLKEKEAWEKDKENKTFNQDYYEDYIKPVEKAYEDNDEEKLYLAAIENEEPENIDEDGDLLTRYNPLSKWDWWQIGGRWSGHLWGEDSIRRSDFTNVDLDKTEDELKEEYPDDYIAWQDLITGKTDSFYRVEYLKERYKTFRNYLEENKLITTWAVIDEEGVWFETGNMGWFGMSDAGAEDEMNWTRNYYDRFIKNLPDDYWLTVVDCHI